MDRYEIIVEGRISGVEEHLMQQPISEYLPDGTTKISGYVQDRTALYGIFARMRDLGLEILKVEKKGKRGELIK